MGRQETLLKCDNQIKKWDWAHHPYFKLDRDDLKELIKLIEAIDLSNESSLVQNIISNTCISFKRVLDDQNALCYMIDKTSIGVIRDIIINHYNREN